MRTHNPTYASYSGDGTGRDSYIILNNGGLTREPKKNMMLKAVIKSSRDLRPIVSKPTPTFKYRSDGTGRDSYVLKNSGGLVQDFRISKADNVFASMLRTNDSPVRAATLLHHIDRSNFKSPEQRARDKVRATF